MFFKVNPKTFAAMRDGPNSDGSPSPTPDYNPHIESEIKVNSETLGENLS
jgi:hypothetical protein